MGAKKIVKVSFLCVFLILSFAFLSCTLFFYFSTISRENYVTEKFGISKEKVELNSSIYDYIDITEKSELAFSVSYLSNRVSGSFGKGRYYLYTVANSEDVLASAYMADAGNSASSTDNQYKIFVKRQITVPINATPDVVSYVELYDYNTSESYVIELEYEDIQYLINEMIYVDYNHLDNYEYIPGLTFDKRFECRFYVKELTGLFFHAKLAMQIVLNPVDESFYLIPSIGVTYYLKKLPDNLQVKFKEQTYS